MKTCAECVLCLLTRDLAAVPPTVGMEQKALYQRDVLRMIADSDPSLCTPQMSDRIDDIYRAYFGERKQKDFATIKRVYNDRMLALEPRLRDVIARDTDPLACAIRLARVGNYIDFGARHEVDDALFDELLADAQRDLLNGHEYDRLRGELAIARNIVYVSDNAGEIVLDKLLIEQFRVLYPYTGLTLLVRGAPTLNDATAEDAAAVGLTELVPVVGNGSALPGTVWSEISEQARELLKNADVIIAKGQANFETLNGSGLNVFYLLLCKCEYFVRRFQVPRLTGMFVNERRLPPLES